MNTVYILEKGCYLRREGHSLKVIKDGSIVDHIPAEGLKKLLLVGYVSLSGPVLDFFNQQTGRNRLHHPHRKIQGTAGIG